MPHIAPQRLAGAPHAGLHLVGDEQAAGFVDRVHGFAQKARRSGLHAVAGEDGVHHQRRRTQSVASQVRDRLAHRARQGRAGFTGRLAVSGAATVRTAGPSVT